MNFLSFAKACLKSPTPLFTLYTISTKHWSIAGTVTTIMLHIHTRKMYAFPITGGEGIFYTLSSPSVSITGLILMLRWVFQQDHIMQLKNEEDQNSSLYMYLFQALTHFSKLDLANCNMGQRRAYDMKKKKYIEDKELLKPAICQLHRLKNRNIHVNGCPMCNFLLPPWKNPYLLLSVLFAVCFFGCVVSDCSIFLFGCIVRVCSVFLVACGVCDDEGP